MPPPVSTLSTAGSVKYRPQSAGNHYRQDGLRYRCLNILYQAENLVRVLTDPYITAVSFQIKLGDRQVGFRLPSDWRPVQQVLEKQRVDPRYRTQEQALKVAWRIVKDWVEAQMAIVETKMVTMDQVFLPYAITKEGKTLYEHVKDSPLLLGDPKRKAYE